MPRHKICKALIKFISFRVKNFSGTESHHSCRKKIKKRMLNDIKNQLTRNIDKSVNRIIYNFALIDQIQVICLQIYDLMYLVR